MKYAVGSLVKARNREWVVLPESAEEMLVLRPLGGTDDEVTGILTSLESVEPAAFDLPDISKPGDYTSGRLLREAFRIGFRSGAGPFRSFARIAVDPRPYQLVPLLVALKQDPVRILIADDVGIGKTIEASLIAKELLDRGEVDRMAVLCPPHLAEQWQAEMYNKFHLETELVLSSTASRLERNCSPGESLFDRYPLVIVSTEFIKSDRRRDEFLRTCPKLVLVDEAHTCAFAQDVRSGRHHRYQLVSGLAKDRSRHMILVTATPHSGKEAEFRSLLSFLDPSFRDFPEDLAGPGNEPYRRKLAAHFVQRRRADIKGYLNADTPFPERLEREDHYTLTEPYRTFLKKIIRYAHESVMDETGGRFRQRIRWWSALALLRAIASSPAAAEATLRTRSQTSEAEDPAEADEMGRRSVMDLLDQESAESTDLLPGGDAAGDEAEVEKHTRAKLLELAREARTLSGEQDAKLQKAVKIVSDLVKEGCNPIVFCRFIPTAEYVAEALRKRLPSGVHVAAVTGVLPPAERETRVNELGKTPKHVLVCTDCLSEGINLQEDFDAVMHYDLSWNPTRHEQREGRVDRYGQPSDTIRIVTYYGTDNQIDGIVLDVLLRKHKSIRNALGISVPVPTDTEQVLEAIFEGLLLREQAGAGQLAFKEFNDHFAPQTEQLDKEWQASAEREKKSRSMFAQESIKAEEVAKELDAVRNSLGSSADVEWFLVQAVKGSGGAVGRNGSYCFDLRESPVALKDVLPDDQAKSAFKARFERPVKTGELYLSRTHPVVEALASFVADTALDPVTEPLASRCSVMQTSAVTGRSTVLVVRNRYHIISVKGGKEQPMLAEDCQLLAFTGSPQNAVWLDQDEAERLLSAIPSGNVPRERAKDFLQKVLDGMEYIRPKLDEAAVQRGEELLDAHRRVRAASGAKGITYRVEPQLPPDVLGIYIYLPSA